MTGSSRREWAARVQHGGLRVGGAPLASRESGRQYEKRGGRDNGEQQRARTAASTGRRTGQGSGRPGTAVRNDLQDGDGLRVQRTRPGQRGWTTAEHQRRVVRAASARQRGATARCRREGRRPQGRSYPGSVSRSRPFHPRSRSALASRWNHRERYRLRPSTAAASTTSAAPVHENVLRRIALEFQLE